MTRAEEILTKRIVMFPEDLESGMTDESIRRNVVASMSIHAQEFAEFVIEQRKLYPDDLYHLTIPKLYQIFNLK